MLDNALLNKTEELIGAIRTENAPSSPNRNQDAYDFATFTGVALGLYRKNPAAHAGLLNERLSEVMTHHPELYALYTDVLQLELLKESGNAINLSTKQGAFAASVRQSQVATINEELFERLEKILQAGGEQMQPVLNALRTFDVYAHIYNSHEYKPDEKESIEATIATSRSVLLDELPKIADSHKTMRGDVATIRSAITDIRPREIARNG